MKEYIVRIEHGADGAVHYFRTGGEIVRCKDCKWYLDEDQKGCCDLTYSIVEPNEYCSHGERRADDTR